MWKPETAPDTQANEASETTQANETIQPNNVANSQQKQIISNEKEDQSFALGQPIYQAMPQDSDPAFNLYPYSSPEYPRLSPSSFILGASEISMLLETKMRRAKIMIMTGLFMIIVGLSLIVSSMLMSQETGRWYVVFWVLPLCGLIEISYGFLLYRRAKIALLATLIPQEESVL